MKLSTNWTKRAEKLLLGRTIVKIEWMSTEETEDTGWYKRPICLQLDDRSWIFPLQDDEGNDGGALSYYKAGKTDVLPVFTAGDKDTMQEDEKIVYKEEHKKDAVVLAKLKYHNDDHMLQSEIEDSLSKKLKDPNHPNPFDRRK